MRYQANDIIHGLSHNSVISQLSSAFLGLGWDKSTQTKTAIGSEHNFQNEVNGAEG